MKLARAIALALALGLTACGGGSNVRPTTTNNNPPPPSPPPGGGSSSDQPALDADLTLTNAIAAHDAGYTGQGITIGVVDTGINPDHPALTPRVKKLLIYVDPSTNDTTKGDVVGHGTMVSQVAAGAPFDQFPGGIAPAADLVSARIINDKAPSDNGSNAGSQVEPVDAQFFAQTLIPDLISNGVQVMNNSWGGLYWDPNNQTATGQAFGDAFRPFVIDHGGLVVFAAGNDSQSNPSDMASIPYWSPDLEQGWLVVAALDTLHPDQLASYSNQCGRSMNYCLVAPGDVVVMGANDTATSTSYYVVSGTSFAAPAVSGAAAVVWQAFPYFNNDLVRQTLLTTAKDLGAPGVDPVFGWGLLDVGKAIGGPAAFDFGDVSVSFDGMTSTWSNDISGAGGLTKSGNGELDLTGQNTYAGTTVVDAGIVKATYAIPADAAVHANGTLNAPGVDGNLNNAGTLVVAGGDVNVKGNYTQASTGTVSLSLGSILKVGGSATLSGGTLNIVGAESGYVTNAHQNVLTATGGLTGTFSNLTLASGVFLSSTLQYDVNDVWLDTTTLSIVKTAAASISTASMAGAVRLDGAFQQLNSTLSGGGSVSASFLGAAAAIQHTPSNSLAAATLSSLSGQLHAASAAMTLEALDASQQALSDHVDGLIDRAHTHGTQMWLQNLSRGGGMSGGGFDAASFQLDGWVAGSERWVGPHTLAGFSFGQSHGYQRLDARIDHDRSHATHAAGYMAWVRGGWYGLASVGVGSYQQQISRELQLGMYPAAVGTAYHGRWQSADLQGGVQMGAGALKLTPFVGVQYARVTRDGFTENGGYGFGLKSPTQTLQRWQGSAGLRASHQWDFRGGARLDVGLRLAWEQNLATRGGVFDASFTGLDQWQAVNGIGLSDHGAVMGLNAVAQLTPASALSLQAQRSLGNRVHSSTLMARYQFRF